MLWADATTWLNFSLPNAPTWTCMVLVLIVMLFVRFAKPLQLRHLDLLLLFVLAIPMLFLRDSQERRDDLLKFWTPKEQPSCFIVMTGLQIAAPMQAGEPTFLTQLLLDQWQRHNEKWIRAVSYTHLTLPTKRIV